MSLSTYQLASILILLPSHVIGQIVQNNWVSPDGTEPDFQQTFINSDVLEVAWEGWNSSTCTQYFEEESTTADLWVTSYNFALSPFSQLLSENINVAESGSYTWAINIDSKTLSISGEYVLRFTTPGKDYNNVFVGVPNIPSPGFIVLGRPSSSSASTSTAPLSAITKQSATTVSSLSSSSNSTPSISNTLIPSSTSTVATTASSTALAPTSALTSTSILTSAIALAVASSPTPTSITRAATSLKPSALAGVVVGSVIGGIVATVLLVFVFRRYWSNTSPPPPPYEPNDYYDIPLCPRGPPLTELPSPLPEFASKSNVPELPAISYSMR